MKPKTENRTRWECVCVWKIILTLFFPLTVHFSTSFVFQVSFWKMNREPTVSSKTSCFSPSQLLLLPIVQVLLQDSCDENLINFNKLLWRKTSKQRNISDACCGSSSSSVGSCGASVIKKNLWICKNAHTSETKHKALLATLHCLYKEESISFN